jgi:hypothetical protein
LGIGFETMIGSGSAPIPSNKHLEAFNLYLFFRFHAPTVP